MTAEFREANLIHFESTGAPGVERCTVPIAYAPDWPLAKISFEVRIKDRVTLGDEALINEALRQISEALRKPLGA